MADVEPKKTTKEAQELSPQDYLNKVKEAYEIKQNLEIKFIVCQTITSLCSPASARWSKCTKNCHNRWFDQEEEKCSLLQGMQRFRIQSCTKCRDCQTPYWRLPWLHHGSSWPNHHQCYWALEIQQSHPSGLKFQFKSHLIVSDRHRSLYPPSWFVQQPYSDLHPQSLSWQFCPSWNLWPWCEICRLPRP